jgi:two-component system, NtrC family, response regulator GlrR
MIGASPAFLAVLRLIDKLAACDATLLIEGETGTGKELAARAVHAKGARRANPFVSVNCGALPDLLIENELFGHERGAYTDARADAPGLLSIADGGTLFLDEIDSLTPKAQVILLRVLQEQCYRPLGARHEKSVDVRIIAASNRDLQTLTRNGVFRDDLLFRINLLYLELPPLRERPGDAELLARDFIHRFSERYQRCVKPLSPDTTQWFSRYAWPGNVRELENLVHREFLLADSQILTIPCPTTTSETQAEALAMDQSASSATQHTQYSTNEIIVSNAYLQYSHAKENALKAFSEHYLDQLMQQTRGNVSEAARHAGKERRALGRLLKKYGVAPAEYRQP